MIFPFKIRNTNTNTNTNSHDWDELNPEKEKEKKNGEWGGVRPWGRKMVVERGHEGGGWVRSWEGGWLVGYRCEMGEGYGHMGCVRWAREMRGLCEIHNGEPDMRESESCAWLLMAMWVRELRDEEGEAVVWVRELKDEERVYKIFILRVRVFKLFLILYIYTGRVRAGFA